MGEDGERPQAPLSANRYQLIRELAHRERRRERKDVTWSATGIAHEAFLRHDGRPPGETTRDFKRAYVQTIRRVLVDRARFRTRQKRGGGVEHVPLTAAVAERMPDYRVEGPPPEELLDLDDALQTLEEHHPRAAQIVELRYFLGHSIREAAETLGISPATAKKDWQVARSLLYALLREPQRLMTRDRGG